MTPGENILEFRPRDPNAAPIVLKPPSYDGCPHTRFSLVVDDKLRTVECSQCKTVLDPVECLIRWAGIYRKVDTEYEFMRKRNQELEKWKRLIDKQADRARMTPEELKMNFEELRAKHSLEGCPRDRMWFDRRGMICCYCGVGHNASIYVHMAEEVREAREKVRLRASLSIQKEAS